MSDHRNSNSEEEELKLPSSNEHRRGIGLSEFSTYKELSLLWILCFGPTVIVSIFGSIFPPDNIPIENTNNYLAIRYVFYVLLHGGGLDDSWYPMKEALETLHGPNSDRVYEYLFFTKLVRFQYPMTSLIPIDLLTWIGLGSVRNLNLINCVVAGLASIGMFRLGVMIFKDIFDADTEYLKRTGRTNRILYFLSFTFAASCLVYYPLIRALMLGQIQVWIDCIFIFAVLFWLSNKKIFSGVCMGCLCCIKPQFGLFLLWGVLSAEYIFSISMAACVVSLAILSIGLYGMHNNVAYIDVISFLSKQGEVYFANNSINGILNSYLSPADPYTWDRNSLTPYVPAVYLGTLAMSLISVVLVILLGVTGRGKRDAGIIAFAIVSIFTVVASPVAWEHHYGILLPLYVIALKNVVEIATIWRKILVAFCLWSSWVLVANFIPYSVTFAYTPMRFLQANFFIGAILLMGVFLMLLFSRRQGGAQSGYFLLKVERVRV